ncbi:MAG TPA: SprT family zinc-dependent metalloprotease [Pseudonocardia sp.]|nr:SprT family zinc-dependent metalloprotease [Pseudonocardia sp.]
MSTRELIVDGHLVVINVRESRRARTMRLVVAPGRQPEVIVPAGGCRGVDEFLRSNQRWLADKLAALRAVARRPPVLPEDPGTVWLAGEPIPVVHDPAGRSGAAMREGRLVVGGEASSAGDSLERWFRREARHRLTEAADRHASALGVEVAAITVRDQRTRWGSCSHNGRLSFSWRLVLAPAPVLSYVVLHELCHLREFNHSRAFWRLVESIRPDWRDAAGWLREHGYELHAYQPERALVAAPEPGESEDRESDAASGPAERLSSGSRLF